MIEKRPAETGPAAISFVLFDDQHIIFVEIPVFPVCNLPIMAIRILEISAIAAPEHDVRMLGYPCPGFFGLPEYLVHFLFGFGVVGKRDAGESICRFRRSLGMDILCQFIHLEKRYLRALIVEEDHSRVILLPVDMEIKSKPLPVKCNGSPIIPNA